MSGAHTKLVYGIHEQCVCASVDSVVTSEFENSMKLMLQSDHFSWNNQPS